MGDNLLFIALANLLTLPGIILKFGKMSSSCILAIIVIYTIILTICESKSHLKLKPVGFEVYLVNTLTDQPNHPEQKSNQTEDRQTNSSSEVNNNRSISTASRHPNYILDIEYVPNHQSNLLRYFRDMPRKHWSCCMLGKLAGEKGFHCQASFYNSKIQKRNFNRAHNKNMRFNTPSRRYWGLKIMQTFEKCVSHRSDEFHKCCYAADIEQIEMRKWQTFINTIQRKTILHS